MNIQKGNQVFHDIAIYFLKHLCLCGKGLEVESSWFHYIFVTVLLVSGPLKKAAEQICLVWDLVVALWGKLNDEQEEDDEGRKDQTHKVILYLNKSLCLNAILMTYHYPDLLTVAEANFQPIRSTTKIWMVTRHQYRISALVFQTSFRGETSTCMKTSRNIGCPRLHTIRLLAHQYRKTTFTY